MTPAEITAMHIANCAICTLAENMRNCAACKFAVGLAHKTAPAVSFTAEHESLEKLQAMVRDMQLHNLAHWLYGEPAEPESEQQAAEIATYDFLADGLAITPEQAERDEWERDWRDTYASLI